MLIMRQKSCQNTCLPKQLPNVERKYARPVTLSSYQLTRDEDRTRQDNKLVWLKPPRVCRSPPRARIRIQDYRSTPADVLTALAMRSDVDEVGAGGDF